MTARKSSRVPPKIGAKRPTPKKVPPKVGARKLARKGLAASRRTGVRRGKPQRPSILSPKLEADLIKLVEVGNSYEVAARASGIARSTLYRWLATGRQERERQAALASEGVATVGIEPELAACVHLVNLLEEAEARAEAYAVTRVRSLMDSPDHQVRARAAFGYLERKHPERWSRREHHEVVMSGDAANPVEVRVVTEQRERTVAILAVLDQTGALRVAGKVPVELPEGEPPVARLEQEGKRGSRRGAGPDV